MSEPPGARPYDPVYCDLVVRDMAEGYSLTAFAGSIGASRGAIDAWIGVHPVFAEAVERGRALRLRRWEQMGLDCATKGAPGSGAVSMIIFGLKNLGDEAWTDAARQEHSGAFNVSIGHGSDGDL